MIPDKYHEDVFIHGYSSNGQKGYLLSLANAGDAAGLCAHLLKMNLIRGQDTWRFFLTRADKAKAIPGVEASKDPRRVLVMNAYGTSAEDAAQAARSQATSALTCNYQWTIMEPHTSWDSRKPSGKNGRQSPDVGPYNVTMVMHSAGVANAVALRLDKATIISEGYSRIHPAQTTRKAVCRTKGKPSFCRRCGEPEAVPGSCHCEHTVFTFEHHENVNTRMLAELRKDIGTGGRVFYGSAVRPSHSRGRKPWGTAMVPKDKTSQTRKTLDQLRSCGVIQNYYEGDSLDDTLVMRCDACGQRHVECSGKGSSHVQAHRASEKKLCPAAPTASPEVTQLEGFHKNRSRRGKRTADQNARLQTKNSPTATPTSTRRKRRRGQDSDNSSTRADIPISNRFDALAHAADDMDYIDERVDQLSIQDTEAKTLYVPRKPDVNLDRRTSRQVDNSEFDATANPATALVSDDNAARSTTTAANRGSSQSTGDTNLAGNGQSGTGGGLTTAPKASRGEADNTTPRPETEDSADNHSNRGVKSGSGACNDNDDAGAGADGHGLPSGKAGDARMQPEPCGETNPKQVTPALINALNREYPSNAREIAAWLCTNRPSNLSDFLASEANLRAAAREACNNLDTSNLLGLNDHPGL